MSLRLLLLDSGPLGLLIVECPFQSAENPGATVDATQTDSVEAEAEDNVWVGFEVSNGASASFSRCRFVVDERWGRVVEGGTVSLQNCMVSGLSVGERVRCGWGELNGGELRVTGGQWSDTDLAARSGARVRFDGVDYRGKGSLLRLEDCAFQAHHCRFREFGDLSNLINVGRDVQAQFRLCEFESSEPLTPEILAYSGIMQPNFQACLWNGELLHTGESSSG